MNNINFALLLPVIVLQLCLQVYTIVHIVKHQSYKFGNMWVWIVATVISGIVAPIVYFVFGKGNDY